MANDIDIVVGAQDKATSVLNRVAGNVGSFGSSFATLGPIAAGVTAAIAATTTAIATLQAVAANFTETVNRIDALTDTARGLGETVPQLRAFQFALEEAGNVDAEKTIQTLQKLQRTIGEAVASGKDEAFSGIGLDVQSLATMAPTDQFREIAAAIRDIESGTERATVSQRIFGKAASDLIPALMSANDELQQSEEFARRTGIAVDDVSASSLAAMNDAIGRVSLALEGIFATVGVQLAPVITELALTTVEWVITAKEFGEVVLPSIVNGFVLIGDAAIELDKALGIIPENTQLLSERVAGIRKDIEESVAAIASQREMARAIGSIAEDQPASDPAADAYSRVVATLERRFAVAQMSEQFVKAEEELAIARNDIERERIALLQEEIAKQEQLNQAAEDRAKEQELAVRDEEEKQKKLDAVQPGVRATESRLLTRGPVQNDVQQKILDEAKKQLAAQQAANGVLQGIYEAAKGRTVYLKQIGGN